MSHDRVVSGRVWSLLAGVDLVIWLLGLGLAAFTIALVVLIWTRWGQYRPVQKCLVLSLSAHLLLAGYATTVKIVGMNPSQPDTTLQISLIDGPGGSAGDDVPSPPAAEKTPLPLLEISGPPDPPQSRQGGSRQADFSAGRSTEANQPAEAGRAAQADGRDGRCGCDGRWGGGSRARGVATAAERAGGRQARRSATALPAAYRAPFFARSRDLAQGRGGSPRSDEPCRPPFAGWPEIRVPTAIGASASMKGAASPRGTAVRRHRGRQRRHRPGFAGVSRLGPNASRRPPQGRGPPRTGIPFVRSGRRRNFAGRADLFAECIPTSMAAFA